MKIFFTLIFFTSIYASNPTQNYAFDINKKLHEIFLDGKITYIKNNGIYKYPDFFLKSRESYIYIYGSDDLTCNTYISNISLSLKNDIYELKIIKGHSSGIAPSCVIEFDLKGKIKVKNPGKFTFTITEESPFSTNLYYSNIINVK